MKELYEILEKAPVSVQDSWSRWLIFDILKPIILDTLRNSKLVEYYEKVEDVSQIIQLSKIIESMIVDMLDKYDLDNEDHKAYFMAFHLHNILVHMAERTFNPIIVENMSKITSNDESNLLRQWYEKLEQITQNSGLQIEGVEIISIEQAQQNDTE